MKIVLILLIYEVKCIPGSRTFDPGIRDKKNCSGSRDFPCPGIPGRNPTQDSFEPDSVQVPVRVPTLEEPVNEEPKEDFEKQYFSKRLKNMVSSWNVSMKTVRKTSSQSEGL